MGGIPCQPWSVAGKRAGADDPRHLWPDALRVVRECEPEWVFIENVGGFVRDGYFGLVRPDLEGAGYRVEAGLFEAAEVGAPHERERLFILAYSRREHLDVQQRSQPPREPTRGRERMAISSRGGRRERGEPSTGLHAPQPHAVGGCGGMAGALGDAGCTRREGCKRHGSYDEPRAPAPRPVSESSNVLADTEPLEVDYSQAARSDGARGITTRAGLPLFPPGPGLGLDSVRDRLRELLDRDPGLAWRRYQAELANTLTWREILAFDPALAPATQPHIRGVEDGLADGVDLTRTARLRLTGNGVVPLQAAYAWRTLRARFGVEVMA